VAVENKYQMGEYSAGGHRFSARILHSRKQGINFSALTDDIVSIFQDHNNIRILGNTTVKLIESIRHLLTVFGKMKNVQKGTKKLAAGQG
jgi:hypothetical protein